MSVPLKKIILWIFISSSIVFLIMVISSINILNFIGWTLCANESKDVVYSPDKTRLVNTIVRDCGATTNYFSLLIYRRSNPIIQMERNLLGFDSRQNIQAKWIDNKNLVIFYDRYSGPPFPQVSKWDGITIKYVKY